MSMDELLSARHATGRDEPRHCDPEPRRSVLGSGAGAGSRARKAESLCTSQQILEDLRVPGAGEAPSAAAARTRGARRAARGVQRTVHGWCYSRVYEYAACATARCFFARPGAVPHTCGRSPCRGLPRLSAPRCLRVRSLRGGLPILRYGGFGLRRALGVHVCRTSRRLRQNESVGQKHTNTPLKADHPERPTITLGWSLEHPPGILENNKLLVYFMVSRSEWHPADARTVA